MTDSDLARRIAADLLGIGAVTFSPKEPFTWASGLRSPVYCDNRLTLGNPEIRSRIADGLSALVNAYSVDIIAGTATAGIPHAAWVSERLSLPMVYVRGAPKAHGQGRQIEGPMVEGRRVALIEDLVSTGGSSIRAVRALQEEGAIVSVVVAIFSYGLPVAEQVFRDEKLALRTLSSFTELRSVAEQENRISASEAASIDEWRLDPAAWSNART